MNYKVSNGLLTFCMIDDYDRLMQGFLTLLGAVHARLLKYTGFGFLQYAVVLHIERSSHPHQTTI